MEGKVRIANIVVTASVDIELNLDLLSDEIIKKATGFHYEYIPQDFPAAIIKFPEPKATVLIFPNGRLNCSGCKSRKDIDLVLQRILGIISKYHKSIELPKRPKPNIINVVCSADIGREVGCGVVQKAYGDSVEHSRFGGGSFVVKLGEGTIRFFPSGKLVGIGFNSIRTAKATIKEAIKRIGDAIEKETFDSARERICKLERFNPAAEIVYVTCKKLRLSTAARLEAIRLLEDYCDELVDGSLKAQPKSLAGGVIYLACIQTGERRTQAEIAKVMGSTSSTIRKTYRLILRVGLKKFATKSANEICKQLGLTDKVRSEATRFIADYSRTISNEWLLKIGYESLGATAVYRTCLQVGERIDIMEEISRVMEVSCATFKKAYGLLLETLDE